MKRGLFIGILVLAVAAPGIAVSGDSAALPVSAVVLANSNCRFQAPTAAVMNFGNLDSGNPVNVNATATLRFRCNGGNPIVVFAITDNDGLHASPPGAHNMVHETDPAAVLPYSLALNPSSGTVPRNTNQTLTITGTVQGAGYAGALPGNYSDTVVVTIVP